MSKVIKPSYLQEEDKTEDNDGIVIPKGPKQTKEYLEMIPAPVGYRMLIRPYTGAKK